MRRFAGFVAVAALLMAGAPVMAQFGMQMPQFGGVWNPVVGSGAAYEITNVKDNQKSTFQMAVVSKDDATGGYWVEIQMTMSNGQSMLMKSLMVKSGAQIQVTRTIIQIPGRGPMELPAGMMGGGGMGSRGAAPAAPLSSDFRSEAELVGNESITTPAGTFDAAHWRKKDGTANVWLIPAAGPWGFVKAVTTDSSIVLTKVITDAKDQITGTPQQMGGMGRGRGGN